MAQFTAPAHGCIIYITRDKSNKTETMGTEWDRRYEKMDGKK